MNYADLPLTQLARHCFESAGNDAWEELVHRLQPVFHSAAYRVAIQWGRANVRDLDDVVQGVWKTVLERRAGLSRLPVDSDAAAYGYFKALAANSAQDHFRAKHAGKRDEGKTEEIEARIAELASELGMKDIETRILIAQVDAALQTIATEKQQSIFWLYYQQGLTVKEIAAAIQNELSDKGVDSLNHRLIAALREILNPGKGESGEKPS